MLYVIAKKKNSEMIGVTGIELKELINKRPSIIIKGDGYKEVDFDSNDIVMYIEGDIDKLYSAVDDGDKCDCVFMTKEFFDENYDIISRSRISDIE